MVTLKSRSESDTAALKSFRGGKDIDMYSFIDKVLLCVILPCAPSSNFAADSHCIVPFYMIIKVLIKNVTIKMSGSCQGIFSPE